MQSGKMPLQNRKIIDRVRNIVNPADIELVHRDCGYGAILEEETYEFANCDIDDNFFIVEDLFQNGKGNAKRADADDIEEHNLRADELCTRYSDEDTEVCIKHSDNDSLSCSFREFKESERAISGLSSSRLLVKLDLDITSCSSSILTAASYTRHHVPDTMRKTLQHQLALLLEQYDHTTLVKDANPLISKLKVRKRVLERSCYQENFLKSLRGTNSRIISSTSW